MFIEQTNRKTDTSKSKREFRSGFTLLEVMIAVSIFGFLMLYVSQFMRLEIRLFDKATREDNLEQSARFAMMHTVDQIRRIPNPTFKSGPDDAGIYYTSNSVETCKINLKPADLGNLTDGTIYYDEAQRKLMLKKETDNYLIADHIRWIKFELDGSSSHLLKIDILAKNFDPSNPNDSDDPSDPEFLAVNAFQLITWVRF